MSVRTLIMQSFYQDSVVLMRLASLVRSRPGVREAAAFMGTPANHEILAQTGLATAETCTAQPNDLILAVDAATDAAAKAALAAARELLMEHRRATEQGARTRPRTLNSALRQMPNANLVAISVPGAYAKFEALRALKRGLHVFLFSGHVPVEDEVALKHVAVKKGLLLMGPDCGTAILNGVPLGFANAVPRGRVGIVSASGTGLQQVAVLLAVRGEGISQAIGVGGRDMTEQVGGLMTLQALDALGADSSTELLIVIGKPPADRIRQQVEARLRALGKPSVMALLGRSIETRHDGVPAVAATLEEAAEVSVSFLHGRTWTPRPFTIPLNEVHHRLLATWRELAPEQQAVRALYAGGTLAHEAALILEPLLGPVATNLVPGSLGRHRVTDLGADEFTLGRPHPMIDSTLRAELIRQATTEPDVAVLLLDVVLGYGAAPDPASDLAPAIEAARAEARAHGRGLAVVVSVIGTPGDPQGHDTQMARLEAAGAWVLPSNAQAARAAACIAGGDAVAQSLLGSGVR